MHSNHLTRYLLGELPEDEMQRMAALRATDQTFSTRLQMVEDDLVDTFVRGQLAGDDLARFRRFYLAFPERRERVKIAQGFLDELPVAEPEPARWRRFLPQARTSGRGWPLMKGWGFPLRMLFLFTALLLFAIGIGLALEFLRTRQHLAESQSLQAQELQQNQALREQLTQQDAAEAQLDERLRLYREQLARGQNPAAAQAETAALRTASFTLPPPSLSTEAAPEFALTGNTEHLFLQLELGRDTRAGYRAELRILPDGALLWSSGALKPRNGEFGQKIVEVKIPASPLKTRAYVLKVSGATATELAEGALNYPFRIFRQ